MYDTAGEKRYRAIAEGYFKGAAGFFVMYDVTKRDSFNAVTTW